MSRAFADIAFTPSVKAAQSRYGSREANEVFEHLEDPQSAITPNEAEFISLRDSFYIASISENGWPYVQHRGGPIGFLRVLDEKTIGFADFRGNRQYLSVGNINALSRVSLILVDYPNRVRLKIWGTATIVHESENPRLIAQLEDPKYRARIERAFVINIDALEWNCPQHIIPRYSESEISALIAPVLEENKLLKAKVDVNDTKKLGTGSLTLKISGIREVGNRIRIYRLESASSPESPLPLVSPGSHLRVPFLKENGDNDFRHYSIFNTDPQSSYYEIAVLKENNGRGGSVAIHRQYNVGRALNCYPPVNRFEIVEHNGPAVLIAGGIGITPILSFAKWFHNKDLSFELHYAFKEQKDMLFRDEIAGFDTSKVNCYCSEVGKRMPLEKILSESSSNSIFYVCGPVGMLSEIRALAQKIGISEKLIRYENFSAPINENARKFDVYLNKSKISITVSENESILDLLISNGVKTDYDCKIGECGMCRVKVLEGQIQHLDSVLIENDRANGMMCTCVSRGLSERVVLDI